MNRKAPVRLRRQRYSLARSHSLVQHRRVDREDRPLSSAEVLADQERPRTRSVTLSSRRLGLVAKIDMVESDGETVVPVDYKRGKRPHVAAGAYEPERVQICVQGLLLEENGHSPRRRRRLPSPRKTAPRRQRVSLMSRRSC